jgi:hypothetical protein
VNLFVLRVELSGDHDRFFHYVLILDESAFRCIREEQQILVCFSDFPSVLVQMIGDYR